MVARALIAALALLFASVALAVEDSFAEMAEVELAERVELVRLSYAEEYSLSEQRNGAREHYVYLQDEDSRPTGDDRFAVFQLAGIHRVLLLRRQAVDSWSASIDLNADGRFSEEEEFALRAESKQLQLSAEAGLPFRIEIDIRGTKTLGDRLRVFRAVHRKGTVELLGRRYTFGLWASGGGFAAVGTRLSILLDGREEWFTPNGRALWLAGRSFGFESDISGSTVRFFELGLDPEQNPTLVRGTQAPTFDATTLGGEPFELVSTRGAWVLLYFWGSWCKPCVSDTAAWVELQQDYASRGFRIVSVSVADDPVKLTRYVRKKRIPWVVIAEDWNDPVSSLYRVHSFPTTFLLDPAGTIVERGLSPASLREWLDERLTVGDPSD